MFFAQEPEGELFVVFAQADSGIPPANNFGTVLGGERLPERVPVGKQAFADLRFVGGGLLEERCAKCLRRGGNAQVRIFHKFKGGADRLKLFFGRVEGHPAELELRGTHRLAEAIQPENRALGLAVGEERPAATHIVRKAVVTEDLVHNENQVMLFTKRDNLVPFGTRNAVARRVVRRDKQQNLRLLRRRKQAVGIQDKTERRAAFFASEFQEIRCAFQVFQFLKRIEQRVARHRRQDDITRIAESLEQYGVGLARTRSQNDLACGKVTAAFAVIFYHRLACAFPASGIGVPATEILAGRFHRCIHVDREPRLHRAAYRHINKRFRICTGTFRKHACLYALQFGKKRRRGKIFRQAGREHQV